MQLALYRAERPEVFEDIIGQKHIVRILQNQLKTGTVSQAYLFAGTHGTGKTSTARILAKAVNCTGGTDDPPCGSCENCEAIRDGRFVDVVELDAVHEPSLAYGFAVLAAAAGRSIRTSRAVDRLGEYPRGAGLAGAVRTRKKISLADRIRPDLVLKDLYDVLLAYYVFEYFRPLGPVQCTLHAVSPVRGNIKRRAICSTQRLVCGTQDRSLNAATSRS